MKLEHEKWRKRFQDDSTNLENKYVTKMVTKLFNSADMEFLNKQEDTFRFLLQVVKFQKRNAVADRDDLVVVNLALNTMLQQVVSHDYNIVPVDKFYALK